MNLDKFLSTSFKDAVPSMRTEELESVILDSTQKIKTIEDEKAADAKLAEAKEISGALSGGYRDAIKSEKAKIHFVLATLKDRGIDISRK